MDAEGIRKAAASRLESIAPLPIDAEHWRAIVRAMGLSPQQARVVECMLRGMSDKQISLAIGLREPTVRTYLQRISARVRTSGRMGIAVHVLGVSHRIHLEAACHLK